MRTTLVLDDDLLRAAKRRAIERDVTLSEMVNEALRESLRQRPGQAPPFTLVTYGRGARTSRHEPTDFKVILDDEDRGRSG
jgi:hypothetical protein